MKTESPPERPAGDGGGGRERTRKAAFATLVFAHLVNDMSGAFFAPLAPLIAEKFGLTLTMLGLILTIRSFFNSLPQPVFGWLVDRYPSKWWLLSTPLLVGFFRSAMGFATGFWSLVAMLSIAALAGACFHPAAAARASEVGGARKGLVMAGYIAGGRLGHAAGPMVALGLVAWLGLEGLVLATGIYFFSMAAMSRFLPPKGSLRPERKAPGGEPGPRSEAPPSGEVGPGIEAPPGGEAVGSRWGSMTLLYFITVFRNMVMINLYAFIPLFFAARGESLWAGGAALSVFLVSGGVGGVAGGWLSDRVGRKRVIALTALAVPLFLIAFLRTEGPLQIGLIVILGLILHGSMGVSVTYAQELLPARPALAASFMQGGNWFISGFTLTAMGALGDRFGLQTALHALAAVAILEFLLSLLLPKDRGALAPAG